MGYRAYVSLNVAIIGGGKVSEDLTEAIVMAGHVVYRANKDGLANDVAPELLSSGNVFQCSIEDAAANADFIVIATPPQDVREVAYWLGDVRQKVIIDITANIHITGYDYINTVGAINAITGSTNVVKVLNIFGYEHLFSPLFGGTKVELLLAGDSRKAKEITKIIAKELGVTQFYDFGGSDTFCLFDEMAHCCLTMIDIHHKQKRSIPIHSKSY